MHRRLALTATVFAFAATLGACGSSGGAKPATRPNSKIPAVVIKTFQFTPNPASATAGTIVVRNDDDTTHTFTSGNPGQPDGSFDVRLVGPNATQKVTVKPGTYKFFCRIHTSMTGELVVH